MTFHPNHETLHGVTVVVTGASGKTYLGRYHERTGRGVLLHDVGVHDPGGAPHPRDEWLRLQDRFGVKVEHRHMTVPLEEVADVVPFLDWLAGR
jgi:hypothetical protein